MNFKQLAENLGLEEDECMELIELFIETGISDLENLTPPLMREMHRMLLMPPTL